MSDAVTEYWEQHYNDRSIEPLGLCSLCGGWGWIDTSGVTSPRGIRVGRRQPCLCPNGQSVRQHGRVVGVAVAVRREREP